MKRVAMLPKSILLEIVYEILKLIINSNVVLW